MNEYFSIHNLEQINLSLSIDYTLYNVKLRCICIIFVLYLCCNIRCKSRIEHFSITSRITKNVFRKQLLSGNETDSDRPKDICIFFDLLCTSRQQRKIIVITRVFYKISEYRSTLCSATLLITYIFKKEVNTITYELSLALLLVIQICN